MNKLPTQFLLHQLANNEQDRERFNLAKSINFLEVFVDEGVYFTREETNTIYDAVEYNYANILYQEKIIRNCLSRVNRKAVLGVFEGEEIIKLSGLEWINEDEFGGTRYIAKSQNITDILYEAFDHPLRSGKPLEEAVQALHKKMLELVPEYKEFCKNNK